MSECACCLHDADEHDEDGACTIGVWEYKRNASDGDKWARCWCPCKSFRSVIGEK